MAARTVVRCACGTSYKQATIYVATLNLSLAGTDELTEEDPGGFVALNDDDDDHDEVVDLMMFGYYSDDFQNSPQCRRKWLPLLCLRRNRRIPLFTV